MAPCIYLTFSHEATTGRELYKKEMQCNWFGFNARMRVQVCSFFVSAWAERHASWVGIVAQWLIRFT